MAVAKSTLIFCSGTSTPALIKWSSLASAANNTYFAVGNQDVSKMIILVCHSNSTDVGTTAGYFYIGTSASAATGSSYTRQFSANKLNRMQFKVAPPTTDAKEGLTLSSAGAHIAISVIGPIETARFKDTDGYIKMCKRKATSDLGRVKVAAILLP
jgi:hypothetical protein